jgi:hypothetical protein
MVFIRPYFRADFCLECGDIAVVVLMRGQSVLLDPQQAFARDQYLQQVDFAKLEGTAQ